MPVIIYDIIVSVASLIVVSLLGYSSYKEGTKSVSHIEKLQKEQREQKKRRRHNRQRPLSTADALEPLPRSSF